MSMTAVFVQVDPAELAGLRKEPDRLEALFAPTEAVGLPTLTPEAQQRVLASGPQMLAQALGHFDPAIRQQLEQRLGLSTAALASGSGGEAILKMMRNQEMRWSNAAAPAGARGTLSLEKAWHGVHYVLCGESEPGESLLSQAVLGGVEFDGDADFSGYGPARYFTAGQVAAIAQLLSRPEIEQEAAARFDPPRMNEMNVYPGWQPADAAGVIEALRRLREFYLETARQGKALVASLM